MLFTFMNERERQRLKNTHVDDKFKDQLVTEKFDYWKYIIVKKKIHTHRKDKKNDQTICSVLLNTAVEKHLQFKDEVTVSCQIIHMLCTALLCKQSTKYLAPVSLFLLPDPESQIPC